MTIVCLDMEGVLVPEIWIAFAEKVGIPEFTRTTRDEPDFDKLMYFRINLMKKHGLTLDKVIGWVLAALGKTDFGLYGVVGGMTVIVMLAYTMRLVHGGIGVGLYHGGCPYAILRMSIERD